MHVRPSPLLASLLAFNICFYPQALPTVVQCSTYLIHSMQTMLLEFSFPEDLTKQVFNAHSSAIVFQCCNSLKPQSSRPSLRIQ